MNGLEKAIRTGGYRLINDGFNRYYRLDTVKYIVSENDFNMVKSWIERDDARKAWNQSHLWENPDNVEHTATMTGIMDAYNDYQACLAF